MNGSRHTPGPWRWTDESGGELWSGSRVVLSTEMHNASFTEQVPVVVGEYDDLNLVAAAPELLAALKSPLLDNLVEQIYTYADETTLNALEKWLDVNNAAVARAKGGES